MTWTLKTLHFVTHQVQSFDMRRYVDGYVLPDVSIIHSASIFRVKVDWREEITVRVLASHIYSRRFDMCGRRMLKGGGWTIHPSRR